MSASGGNLVFRRPWSHVDDFVQITYQLLDRPLSSPYGCVLCIQFLRRLNQVDSGNLITVHTLSR